ncbi:MAG TPA: energy transducer TonB [Sphingobium sp.]|nr:energy transducer TonB [Sphingobium sp.]
MHAKPVIVALCACLVVPAAAVARQGSGQLTVVAPERDAVTYEKWTDRTAFKLSKSIRQASTLYRDSSSTGYARVQFRLNGQGRAEAVSLAGPSSSAGINRISMRAIKTMGSLLPLPQQVNANSRFEAWIVVANDRYEKESMLDSLRSQHRAQTMAMAEKDRPILIALR